MSTITDIRGVPVQFPFQPYDLQKDYMEKVIECIQTESIAVLESPTGTGKTLSLLCSSLGWLQLKKAQLQAQRQASLVLDKNNYLDEMKLDLEEKAGEIAGGRAFLGIPTIIYASRTHSQLSQAMQELKRSGYGHMKASVLGSRDHLCIHPEVKAETDTSMRITMCQLKVAARSCHYNNRVEKKKVDPEIYNTAVVDIEDMIKLGHKHTFCPYYMTKELNKLADIIFTPYNYLLDPIARKALGLSLNNCIVILDEGHNIESFCQDSASVDIKTTDLLLAITELDVIMKLIEETPSYFDEAAKDVDPENVANLKGILVQFTDIVQEMPLITTGDDIISFPGDYIFELLEKAQLTDANAAPYHSMIDKMVQLLAAQGSGPFARKGKGLQLFGDFLAIVFASKASKEKIKHCYKVHLKEEEKMGRKKGAANTWLPSKDTSTSKVRILSFWCFSPGFGMELIMKENLKALILTSGTLAPLKPLISELELDVKIRLENPHIVKPSQICVKVLPVGPDGEPLLSNYQNRDNSKYINSLGRAIVNLSRIIPSGLLIFFPSYPIMQKCQTVWQAEGIWADITSQKAIFVEPREKDAFNAAMAGYYEKVNDPSLKGAVFMAVCRGKVSEGLDFADANGRAVIITGLPYPPLKDPRVILKRRYLDQCHAKDKQFLNGSDWYSLEATRAVNQAIGRVIRHRYDYGAILLLDQRFANFHVKERLSRWLRDHVKVVTKYGELIRDLSQFYRRAQNELPRPEMKPEIIIPPSASFDAPQSSKKQNFDFSTSTACNFSSVLSSDSTSTDDSVNQYLGTSSLHSVTTDNPNGTVTIHKNKRENSSAPVNSNKRKRIFVPQNKILQENDTNTDKKVTSKDYVAMVKDQLGSKFNAFSEGLRQYSLSNDIDTFLGCIDSLIPHDKRYILQGLNAFIRSSHKDVFKEYLARMSLAVPEDL